MKSHQIVFANLILVFLIIGINIPVKAQSDKNEESGFNYVIHGKVENGDKVKISLYIPSQGMENRQTVAVNNGEYLFKGKAFSPEAAKIKIEKSIVKFKGAASQIPIFIEKDTVVIDFKIEKDPLAWFLFKEIKYLQGDNNLYYNNTIDEFYEAFGTTSYTDQQKNDSMQLYVYPFVKTKTLDAYEKLYDLNEHQVVSLNILERIVTFKDVFAKEHLNDAEKKKLKLFLDGIDQSVHNTKDYKFVKDRINSLTSGIVKDEAIVFKDFTLLNSNKTMTSIEGVIKSNKITVLDFWWSGCSPCRKFNQETSKVYDKLKEKGIEIISISIDRGKDLWESSSNKDGIAWTNLYAGYKSEIVSHYKITRYPTMFVFDNEMNLIDGYISKAEDLLELLEE